MRRVLIRLCQVFGVIALAWGSTGCIPAFRGFQPVTRELLKPKTKPKDPAEILYLDDYYKVRWGQVGQPSSTTFWRRTMRIRFNERKAFKHATQLLQGDLLALEVRTVCPDGRVVQMGKKDLQQATERSVSYGLGRWSRKYYKFTAPGVAVGCVVDFMWEVELPYQPDNIRWSILRSLPVRKGHYRLVYPSGYVYRVSLRNTESLWVRLARMRIQQAMAKKRAEKQGATSKQVVSAKSSKGKKGGGKELTEEQKSDHIRVKHDRFARAIDIWIKDIPARQEKKKLQKMIRAYFLPARFRYSTYAFIDWVRTTGMSGKDYLVAWRNVDQNYVEKSAYQTDVKEEACKDKLPKIARQVTAKASSRRGKIRAIYEHLRQRMTRVGSGTSSRHKLYKVYQLKRGSQYEINMIMIVMLRSVGIRAYPALVSAYNQIHQADQPTLFYSSMIVYTPPASEGAWKGYREECRKAKAWLAKQGHDYPGGRPAKGGIFLNPANKILPFGKLSYAYANVWAFIADGAGGRFLTTPDTNPQENARHVVMRIKIQKNGAWKGEASLRWSGQNSIRTRGTFYKLAPHLWLKKQVGGTIRRICGYHAKVNYVQKPQLSLNNLSDSFQYRYNFTTTSCIPHGKRHLLLRPLPAQMVSFIDLKQRLRIAPVYFGAPYRRKIEIHYEFPKGYQAQNSLGQHSLRAPGLSGEFKTTVSGNTLRVDFELQRKQREVPARAYPKIKQFYQRLKSLTETHVVIGRKS